MANNHFFLEKGVRCVCVCVCVCVVCVCGVCVVCVCVGGGGVCACVRVCGDEQAMHSPILVSIAYASTIRRTLENGRVVVLLRDQLVMLGE